MLGVSYAAQSLLARAVIESLTGTTLESRKRLPSFADLDEELAKLRLRPEMAPARERVAAKISEIRGWGSPDFLGSMSPRHRITHREHIRCTPVFVHRMPGVQMKPDRSEPLGVAFACKEPVNALNHYSPARYCSMRCPMGRTRSLESSRGKRRHEERSCRKMSTSILRQAPKSISHDFAHHTRPETRYAKSD